MARQHQEKENLLRDAKQMPVRGQCEAESVAIFAGFRSAGQLSLYFDQDPVYQFNSAGELRRAFINDSRLMAEGGKLSALIQPTEPQDTEPQDAAIVRLALKRKILDAVETQRLLAEVTNRLLSLQHILQDCSSSKWECIGAEPDAFVSSLENCLNLIGPSIRIAESPAA